MSAIKELSAGDQFLGKTVVSQTVDTVNNNTITTYSGGLIDTIDSDYISLLADDSSTITKLIIPNTITSIDSSAINTLSNLTTIIFLDGIETIPTNAFKGNTTITSIEFPESVKTIGESAFENCTGIQYVEFNSGLETIGASAFKGCVSITSFGNIPISLKSLNDECFYNLNSDLYGIHYPQGTVEEWKTLILNDGTKYFNQNNDGDGVITNCCNGYYDNLNNELTNYSSNSSAQLSLKFTVESADDAKNIEIQNCKDTDGNIANWWVEETEIDNTYYLCFDKIVVELGENSFLNSNITSIYLTSTITTIGDYAFSKCKKLNSVYVTESLTHLGYKAFEYCSSLNYFDLKTVTSLGTAAFLNCKSLKYVELSDDIEYTFHSTFYNCVNLERFEGGYLFKFENYALYKCEKFNIPSISRSLNYNSDIGKYAFNLCKFDTISLNSSFIGDYALAGNSNLNTIYFIDKSNLYKLKTIEEYKTFVNSKTNSNIWFKQDVDVICSDGIIKAVSLDIVSNTFSEDDKTVITYSDGTTESFNICGMFKLNLLGIDSDKLDTIVLVKLGNKVSFICGYAFYKNAYNKIDSLTSIILHDNIKVIDNYAFSKAPITNINLSNVSFIGDYAFYYSNLESITFPDNITIIPKGVCLYCSNLSSVTFGSKVTTICNYAFDYCTNLTTITIPDTVYSMGYAFADVHLLKSDFHSSLSENVILKITTQSTHPLYLHDEFINGGWYNYYLGYLEFEGFKSYDPGTLDPTTKYINYLNWDSTNSIIIPQTVTYFRHQLNILNGNVIFTRITPCSKSDTISLTNAKIKVRSNSLTYYKAKWSNLTGIEAMTTSEETEYIQSISSVYVVSNPTKTAYYTDDTIDLTGLEIKINYSDGASENVLYNDYTKNYFIINEYDMTTPGTKTITVSCCGKSITFSIIVASTKTSTVEASYGTSSVEAKYTED